MWHFTGCDEDGTPTLGFEDLRVEQIGVPLSVEGELRHCENGLHACDTLLGAIGFAWVPLEDWYGVALGRVELSGEIIAQENKYIARTRTVIERLTQEQTLTFFMELSELFLDRLMKESIITHYVRECITTKDFKHYHDAILELYADNALYKTGSYNEVFQDRNGWYFRGDVRSAIGMILSKIDDGLDTISDFRDVVHNVVYIYQQARNDKETTAREASALESIAVQLFYEILHREEK